MRLPDAKVFTLSLLTASSPEGYGCDAETDFCLHQRRGHYGKKPVHRRNR